MMAQGATYLVRANAGQRRSLVTLKSGEVPHLVGHR
jgi:hypothetical protein